LILVSLTLGISYQIKANNGNIIRKEYIPIGTCLQIDLDSFFGVDHGVIQIYNTTGSINYITIPGASEFWLCDLNPEDSGFIFLEELDENGDVIRTYIFELIIFDIIDSNETNQNQPLNVFSYEE